MTDGQTALLRLMAWLSPAFPVGSFSYSHGLETAAHRGLIGNAGSLRDWLADLLERGSAWNDAVLFAEAHRLMRDPELEPSAPITPPVSLRDPPSPSRGGRSPSLATPTRDHAGVRGLQAQAVAHSSPSTGEVARRAGGGEFGDALGLISLCDLAEALAGSRERHMETMLQGAAFLKAASAWPHPALAALPAECAYPVAVGATAGAHGIGLPAALAAFLQAFASNQIQAAIRLGVIGQVDAMATLAALEPAISATADRASRSTLDDLGSATMMAEIAAMQHETHYSRLFRT